MRMVSTGLMMTTTTVRMITMIRDDDGADNAIMINHGMVSLLLDEDEDEDEYEDEDKDAGEDEDEDEYEDEDDDDDNDDNHQRATMTTMTATMTRPAMGGGGSTDHPICPRARCMDHPRVGPHAKLGSGTSDLHDHDAPTGIMTRKRLRRRRWLRRR